MLTEIRRCAAVLMMLTLVTGVAYPLAITLIGRIVFPMQATGSVIDRDGRALGSSLIGQPFADARHFWSRPSGTAPQPYNAGASTGTNFASTNPSLRGAIHARVQALRAVDRANTAAVPIDLVTASGSGLDPHISPAAAEYQVNRVARTRGWSPERVRQFVADHTERRTFGLLGEARVNVLELNLALDAAP